MVFTLMAINSCKASEQSNRQRDLNNSLINAVFLRDLTKVNNLLEQGANPNFKNNAGETSLIIAAANGHLEIARLLINRNASIEAKDHQDQNALTHARLGREMRRSWPQTPVSNDRIAEYSILIQELTR